jgi:outer membrane protein assembly factor BamE (lipoprotein component of BamABCDE complex)
MYKTISRFVFWSATFVLIISATACSKRVNTHGHVLPVQAINSIQVGVDTKDSVRQKLGSPSSVGTFADDRWYYFTTKTEDETLKPNQLIERDIYIVDFAEGTVAAVHHKDKDDGQTVSPVGRTTPTYGQSLGIVEQLMQNLRGGL